MAFQLVQILFWLSLATWFGGVLFVAMTAPVVVRTVREANPILPHVLAVNLDGQHGTLLAGTIVASMLNLLWRVQLACGGVMLFVLVAQWLVMDTRDQANLVAALVRTGLFLGAVTLTLYNWRFVWPKVWAERQAYIDNADNPDLANPAKDRFDRHQVESANVLNLVLFMLLGMIVFGGLVTPGKAVAPTQSPAPVVQN